MKKLLSLLVIVMVVCLPALGLAGDAGYADPDGRFAFPCPDGWTVLSQENIEDVLKAAEIIQDETFQQMLEAVKPQIEQLGIIILMNADCTCNINVICQNGAAGLTGETLLAAADTLKKQLSAQFDDITFLDEPSVYELGDWKPMMLAYEYSIVGIDMSAVQAYLPKDDSLLVFTLTAQSGQEEQGMSALMEVLLGLE